MSHVYDYFPCSWCGQRVAHTKAGKPLHMHRDSEKCKRIGNDRREAEASTRLEDDVRRRRTRS